MEESEGGKGEKKGEREDLRQVKAADNRVAGMTD